MTEAMPFLQKAILLSYDPRPFGRGIFSACRKSATLFARLSRDESKKKYDRSFDRSYEWLRGLDLNQRPSGYEPDELPDCSTPRYGVCAPLWPFAEAVSLGAPL